MDNKNEAKAVRVEPYFYGATFHCPSCGAQIGYDYDNLNDVNYCSKCGQLLSWDGIKRKGDRG